MTVLDPRPSPTLHPGDAPLRRRAHAITQLPILILFPHSRCNCRCVMCDIWRSTGRDQLSVAEISSWIGEWRALGVKRVVLSGGEALQHGDIWAICDVIRSAHIGISILSTGLLLARHAEDLVARCDDVVVSLDGPQRIHDEIRNVPRAYERLAEGVRAVRAASSAIALSARCTVQQRNFRALRDTVRAARELGLDRISFLAADVSSSAFNRPDGWSDERAGDVAVASEDLPLLAEELDRLEAEHAADFASGFIAEPPDKLRERLLFHFAAHHGLTEFPRRRCNAPWVSGVIEADGTLRPCFFQPALGNVREAGSLGAVLNSDAAVAWRSGLDVERNAICKRCVCTLALEEPR